MESRRFLASINSFKAGVSNLGRMNSSSGSSFCCSSSTAFVSCISLSSSFSFSFSFYVKSSVAQFKVSGFVDGTKKEAGLRTTWNLEIFDLSTSISILCLPLYSHSKFSGLASHSSTFS